MKKTSLHTAMQTRDGGSPSDFEAIAKQLKLRLTEVDGLIEKHKSAIDSYGEADKETRDALKELTAQVEQANELSARLTEVEQKLVEGVLEGRNDPNDIGALLARNEAVLDQAKAITKARGKMVLDGEFNVRNTIGLGSISGKNAVLVKAGNVEFMPTVEQPLTIVDLINWTPVSESLIPLLKESAHTFMADVVEEGKEKPESTLNFKIEELTVSVVAHWVRVTNQLLADMPALVAYIRGRMAYGIRLKLEYLVINGNTTSFSGLLKEGNSVVLPADTNAIDTVSAAKAKAFASFVPPDVVILNPEDWSKIERTKGTDGHYIFGSPGATVTPVLWGVRVIQSAGMPAGKYWIGNITMATDGYIRQDVAVELSTEDRDNFVKNLVTIRAEMRAAFGVRMPDACVTGDLTAASEVEEE
ncbi:phage major capsid protein [Moraxella canis]|uniref:Phage capsid-like C-terminal domain-containing protein n=1 Tax=Moraxella canis TaxID=90239 RepID=A0A1S9ZKV2_9GAMM|nr:phage major capsid protein [Moraxella canis]OOR83907.1 hypothetical protein B0180_05555 [Moraxella canis]